MTIVVAGQHRAKGQKCREETEGLRGDGIYTYPKLKTEHHWDHILKQGHLILCFEDAGELGNAC
jgi:hypothetical protein